MNTVLGIDAEDPLTEAATATALLAGGAVHTFPNTLTEAVDQDIVDLGEVPLLPDAPLTVQRGLGVATMGLGVVTALDALNDMDGMR